MGGWSGNLEGGLSFLIYVRGRGAMRLGVSGGVLLIWGVPIAS